VSLAERSIKRSIKFVNGGSSSNAASMTYLTSQNSHSYASEYRQAWKENKQSYRELYVVKHLSPYTMTRALH
jgi:hypothetical protein